MYLIFYILDSFWLEGHVQRDGINRRNRVSNSESPSLKQSHYAPKKKRLDSISGSLKTNKSLQQPRKRLFKKNSWIIIITMCLVMFLLMLFLCFAPKFCNIIDCNLDSQYQYTGVKHNSFSIIALGGFVWWLVSLPA